MNKLNLGVELLIILVVQAFAQSNIYHKGAYEHEDADLPCMTHEYIPRIEKQAIWWQTKGVDIGTYTPANGFQPSGNFHPEKFDITSLNGTLIVNTLNKTTDSVTYNCGITLINGTDYTDTTAIQLEIGNAPHDFYILTNGSKIGSRCYDHVGLGPMTCSVISDPQSNITWILNDHVGSNCEEALERTNSKCMNSPGAQFNCFNTLTPNPGCFGHYVCVAEYKVGDVTVQTDDCVLVVEYDPLWAVVYIIIAAIAVIVALVAMIAAIIAAFVVICGSIAACTACIGCAACAGCAACSGCASIFACISCCGKRKVTPEQPTQQYEIQIHDSNVPTYTITSEQYSKPTDGNTAFGYSDVPPPYSDLKL